MPKVKITNVGRARRWAVGGQNGDEVELDDYLAARAVQEAWGEVAKPKKVEKVK